MPISFKSKLSSAVANATFLDKTIDDATVGKIALNEASSSSISDIQSYTNELADTDGVVGEADPNRKIYSSNNVVTDGDDRKVAIGKLDAQVGTNETDIATINASVGAVNGIAQLDGTGKLPASQLTVSAMELLGAWNASTNTPTLADGVGDTGDVYRVTVAGTQDLGGGSVDYGVGDWVYYTASAVWEKADNVDDVISVNSQTGAVVLDADDIAESTTRFWSKKHNLDAVVDPTINDDTGDDYTIGSIWINQTTNTMFTANVVTLGAAVWSEISGAGGSGGGFNYITNGKAEDDTTGWTVYANTVAGTAPDDFGGTPSGSFTWTRNTSSPLVATGDFKLTKPASDVQGTGVYYEFTGENGHKSVKSLFSTLIDSSALDDEDLSFWLVSSSDSFVADFNNISANNPDLIAGIPRVFKQFQFDSSDTDYRLCIHWNSTDTTAKDVFFDEIELGPSPVASGAVQLDQRPFDTAPTGSWTNTTYSGFYSRNGDKMSGTIKGILTGTPAAMDLSVTLPSGFVIDTAKIPTFNQGGTSIGTAQLMDNGLKNWTANVRVDNSTTFGVVSNANGGETNITTPFTWASGDEFSVSFNDVPIVSWSSDSIMSEDLGQRDIFVSGAGNGAQVVTANVSNITFNEVSDASGSWTGTTLTAKENMNVTYEGMVRATGAVTELGEYINGTFTKTIGYGNTINTTACRFGGSAKLLKGDTLNIRSATGITLLNSTGSHHIAISKIANPQTVLETQRMSARFSSNDGQAVTGTQTLKFENTDFEDGFDYVAGTGILTANISGRYSIKASVTLQALTLSATQKVNLIVEKNATTEITGIRTIGNGSSNQYGASISGDIDIIKGDTLNVDIATDVAGNLSTSNDENYFSIHRIK